MESDLQFQHHQKQMNSGLTRYQSAPSSYFSNILDRDFCEEFLNRPTSPETERIFARFLANSGGGNPENNPIQNQNFVVAPEIKQDSEEALVMNSITDSGLTQHHQNQNQNQNQDQLPEQKQSNYTSVSQGFYQNQLKPPLPDQNPVPGGMDYQMGNSLIGAGTGRLSEAKSGGSSSNLLRHNSSPAGLFSNITIEMENGYAVMRGMGDYVTPKREASYCSSPATSRPLPLPPTAASGRRMNPITEIENKNNIGDRNSDNICVYDETRSNDYVTGFPMGSWDHDNASSSVMSHGLTDDDRTLSGGLIGSETQNRDSGIPQPPRLSHHLSLPKTVAEMSAIEKFLQLQDSVPCKIRAKRGFATHPRSIAERVRRTRISERMRKLQDVVPNMDKQTNTSDMLDLAIDYIKDLQRQVKTLSDSRANCTCNISQQQL